MIRKNKHSTKLTRRTFATPFRCEIAGTAAPPIVAHGRWALRHLGLSTLFIGSVSVGALTIARSAHAQEVSPTPVPNIAVTAPTATALNPDGSTVASGGLLVESPSFGPFGNTPQNDIPFSVNSIPQLIIEDQQANTTADVLRNDPSVVLDETASQAGYPQFMIRGFDVSNSTSNRVDGLPFTTQSSELIYDYERVDIYKGTNALLYGFSSPGGLVNYVTKRPLDQPLTKLSFDYISPTWFGGTADVSRRFGEGDQFGVRVNLASHGGNLAINSQGNSDALAALALDWKPLPGARVWVNSSFSNDDYRGVQPNFFILSNQIQVPQAPDASKLYGQPFSQHNGTTELIEGGVEGDILPWLSGHVTAGEVAGYRDVQYMGATFLDNNGDYQLRLNPHNLWHLTDYSEEALLSPHFEVGDIKNKLDFGATFNRETFIVSNVQGVHQIGEFNLSDPYFVNEPNIPYKPQFSGDSSSDFNNYVFRDTLDITKYITLMGGIAYSTVSVHDSFGDNYFQAQPTPSGAIIIKPIDGLSIYGSYIEGLQPGTQAADTFAGVPVTNANATLSPFLATQYEVGVKYNLNNALQLNAAVFQITEPNAIYTANNGGVSYTYSDNGEQRNRGVELTAVGKVYEGLKIFSGFTYLDAQIEQSQGGTLNGLQAIAVPHWRGNLFAEYDIAAVPGLTLLGGFFYTGNTYLNSANTLVVPDYVTGDIGAKYITSVGGNQTTFRFYVQNVAGTNHWVTVDSGNLVLGDPRTYKVNVSMRF